jgi:hypothetical protein
VARPVSASSKSRRPVAGGWRALRFAGRRLQRRINVTGAHRFVDRRGGSDKLIVILAGYKSYLWPYTLARLERHIPDGFDVCLVSPAVESAELDRMAERRGWSRLVTRRNQVALAQNLAILAHPAAEWIYKVDEDVLIGDGFFAKLLDGYRRVEADGRHRVGFCAPILNVNGFSYRLFLEHLGLESEYAERFGELTQACMGVRAYDDGAAARWLWERTVPFDAVAARFSDRAFGYSPVPHRFSIGATLMRRDLWEHMHGFTVDPAGPGIGDDEAQLCMVCTDTSRVATVLHDVLAGHFSFGPQEAVMRDALPSLAPGLLMS